MLGGDFTRTKIICKIIDKSTNESTKYQTKAIYQKDKIKYIYEEESYTLDIISPKKLILNRKTKDIENTFYFEENKTIPSIYYMKEQGISLEIEIKTKKIEIMENQIIILYTVVDSDIDYEYNIEMSDE